MSVDIKSIDFIPVILSLHTPIRVGEHRFRRHFGSDVPCTHTDSCCVSCVGRHYAGFTSEKKGTKPREHRPTEIGVCARDSRITCATGYAGKACKEQ
ncbi:hypothetical protein AVEN_114357-1 [Araneus ventricosus]|uniref:Uncharacterized protein n=1 Tax=Araneus ventricosus TaxID=182803 RepID=A0A4Y2M193_ARAVE|nr:hypothetical protein AVEN_114357-1 [Araneus ventricosus]